LILKKFRKDIFNAIKGQKFLPGWHFEMFHVACSTDEKVIDLKGVYLEEPFILASVQVKDDVGILPEFGPPEEGYYSGVNTIWQAVLNNDGTYTQIRGYSDISDEDLWITILVIGFGYIPFIEEEE